jgi:hypothetical protein
MPNKILKKISSICFSSSKKGSIVTTLGVVSATVGLAVMVGSYVLNSQKLSKVVSSESSSLLLNNLVLTRVAQAISSTAILCNHTTEMCYWNEDNTGMALENFGFIKNSSSSAKGEPMTLEVEVCLPEFKSTGVDLKSCENKVAKAELRIKNIEELIGQASEGTAGILSGKLDQTKSSSSSSTAKTLPALLEGSLGADGVDQDVYGILIKVSSTYVDFSQQQRNAEISGIVRRPRFLTRIETSDGFCAPTCQVSSLGDSESDSSFKKSDEITTDSGEKFALLEGNVPKSQSFCLGNVRVINNESAGYSFLKPASITADGHGVGTVGTLSDGKAALSAFNSTKAVIPLRVYNDGPGYLYNFAIQRDFEKADDYNFAPGEGDVPSEVFLDTFTGKDKMGVGPGLSSKEIYDSGLKCFDEKITNITTKRNNVTIELEAKHVYADVGNHHYDGGAYWKTEYTPYEYEGSVTTTTSITPSPSNSKSSGKVTYRFHKVEPANALSLDSATEDATGTKTTEEKLQTDTYVRYATPIILHNTGMN